MLLTHRTHLHSWAGVRERAGYKAGVRSVDNGVESITANQGRGGDVLARRKPNLDAGEALEVVVFHQEPQPEGREESRKDDAQWEPLPAGGGRGLSLLGVSRRPEQHVAEDADLLHQSLVSCVLVARRRGGRGGLVADNQGGVWEYQIACN